MSDRPWTASPALLGPDGRGDVKVHATPSGLAAQITLGKQGARFPAPATELTARLAEAARADQDANPAVKQARARLADLERRHAEAQAQAADCRARLDAG